MFGGKVNQIHEKGVTIPEYSLLDEPNLNARPRMEDSYFLGDNFCDDDENGVFGVLDGHGGDAVAQFIGKNFIKVFKKFHRTLSGDVHKLLNTTYAKLEAQVKMLGCGDIGATCCGVYVSSEDRPRTLFFANLGDTRAVLSNQGTARRLTTDHKATEPSEVTRVNAAGSFIQNGRLCGKLAITRSFGDFDLKQRGLSAEPEIVEHVIQASDELVIIATDGLWDVISDQDAVNLVKQHTTLAAKSKSLIDFALQNGTRDNITVLILRLNQLHCPQVLFLSTDMQNPNKMLVSNSRYLWNEKSRLNLNSLIYIVNEFYFHVSKDKERMIAFGESIGPRIYESMFFQRTKITQKVTTALGAMKFICNNFWPFLFGHDNTSLETFASKGADRVYPGTNIMLSEYVIYDIDPPYLRHCKSNQAIVYFYAGIIKGILEYMGFSSKVNFELVDDENGLKCAYVVYFDPEVLDRDRVKQNKQFNMLIGGCLSTGYNLASLNFIN